MTQDRTYQQQCVAAVHREFADCNRLLGVLATGGGKTVIFSQLINAWFWAGKRTLVLCDQDRLVGQAIEKIAAVSGIEAEREQAECFANPGAEVVVGSVQTLMREKRLNRWAPDAFDFIVCDEADKSIAPSWLKVLNHFSKAKVLGVTATPDRGDKRDLGTFYERIAFDVGMYGTIENPGLIDLGYLAPITPHMIPLKIDINSVGVKGNDLDADETAHAIEPYFEQIAAALKEHAAGRKTLVFLPLIATSLKFIEHCQAIGIRAAHLDGESDDQDEVIAQFTAGELDLISNVQLLGRGVDIPCIDCVCVLRPTKVRSLYVQMVGRGTRLSPGKRDLLLLDFLWLSQNHKLSRPAHLIAGNDEIADIITARLESDAARPGDVESQPLLDMQGLASDAQLKREAALRKRLQEHSGRPAYKCSAAEFAAANGRMDVADYEPTMAWESGPIPENWRRKISERGIDVATVNGRGQAAKLVGMIESARRIQAASPGQRAMLRRWGIDASHMTMSEAQRIIGSRMAQNKRERSYA